MKITTMTTVMVAARSRALWTAAVLLPVFAMYALSAQAQQPRDALTLEEVTTLLTSGVPMAAIQDGIEERGVDFRLTVTIEANLQAAGATEAFLQALRALSALITVTSEPSGAAVSIDGRERGETPLELRLQPGTVRVTLTLDGFLDADDTHTVAPGVAETMHMLLVAAPRLPEAESLQTSPTLDQRRVFLWTGLAAAGLGGVLAVIGQSKGNANQDEVEALFRSAMGNFDAAFSSQLDTLASQGKTAEFFANTGRVALIGGGALTGISFLLGSEDDEGEQNNSIAMGDRLRINVGGASGAWATTSFTW